MPRAGKRRRRKMLSEAEVIADAQRFVKALRNHAADLGLVIPKLYINVGCSLAEVWNSRDKRTVAHVGCKDSTICLAAEFGALNRNKRYGVLTHEVGHLMAGLEGSGAEPRADCWVRDHLGIEIGYDADDTVEFISEKIVMALGL
jgi:hypothetical protein